MGGSFQAERTIKAMRQEGLGHEVEKWGKVGKDEVEKWGRMRRETEAEPR